MLITKKDRNTIAGAGFALAFISAICWALPGQLSLLIPIMFSLVFALVLILEIYRRVNSNLYDLQDQLGTLISKTATTAEVGSAIRQMEALISLHSALKPERPFPNANDFAAAPDLLNQLSQLIFQRKPKLVVETGSGLSTLIIAYSLKRLGHGNLISLENDSLYASTIRDMIAMHHMDAIAHVFHAPLVEHDIHGQPWQWYDTTNIPLEKPIDLLFIDGPVQLASPCARYPAFSVLKQYIGLNTVFLLDDAKRNDEQEIVRRWQHEHPQLRCKYLDFKKGAYLLHFENPGASE